MTTQTQHSKVRSIHHENEDRWSEVTPGERFTIRIPSADTNGIYTMLEIVAEHHNGTSMHIHENEDEHFIILEGQAHFACGGKKVDVGAGKALTVGRGVPHAWCNLSKSPLRMLVIFSPGGFDEFFRAIGEGREPTLDGTGTSIVGPPLFENIYTIASPRY